MPGHPNGRPRIRQLVAALLLLTLILVEVAANPAYSSGTSTSSIAASPGKFDLPLGSDFPTFSSVKLSYPDSAILTNSTGDLLFSVALNPLMLNPVSAQYGVWSEVQVWGSGFSSEDTSCTLSGTPVLSPGCTISAGILTGSFNVADVPVGSYIVTATGDQEGDYSSASFTVLPPSPALLGSSSGPDGALVSISGVGFYLTDSSCGLSGSPISAPTCSITLGTGTLTGSFVVTGPPGTYAITVTTNGGDSGEATTSFTVTSQQITFIPQFEAQPGAIISVKGSGFSPTDTSCSFSGKPVGTTTIPCAIAGGIITSGSFVVANVPSGTYSITATGSTGDMATYNFLVLPAPPITVPVTLDIYIPPDFSGLTISDTWTSFTNSYDSHIIQLSKLSASDQIGPNWWRVSVSISVTNNPSDVNPATQTFLTGRTQYIRLFQVTSPTTAGRYFFKAFINGASIGAQNFPTIVVKASRDPAYISGTLRDLGDRNATRAGQPIFLPNGTGAQVVATGYDYLGRPVSAQAFINSTANGRYTLFGVAPGTYNLTAYAAGYIPITITQLPYPYPFLPSVIKPTPITVAAAQSLEGVDIYLSESANITGTVLSETADGSPISWGYTCSVSFTGITGATCPPGFAATRAITVQLLNLHGTTVVASNQPPYGFVEATDPLATEYSFTIQNELSSWDGRIPQNYANFTSGLPSGDDYLLRAYVNPYVQLDEVRVHVANDTTETEVPIRLIRTGIFDVTVHFKRGMCQCCNSTGSTLIDEPVEVSGTLTVSAYDTQGILRAQNTTTVFAGSLTASIELSGFSSARQRGTASLFSQNYGILPGTYYILARFTAAPPVLGNAATTTNAPVPGALVVGDLYYQTSIVLATIGLGEGIVQLSFPLFESGGIKLGLYSIDYEIPPLPQPWGFPGSAIQISIIPTFSLQTVFQTNTTQLVGTANDSLTILGLQTGGYDVVVRTLGYTQREIVHLNVALCWNADAPIWMIKNPVIDLTIAFRDEGLLTSIDSTLPFAQPINNLTATPTRIETFDDLGNFVAANATYISNGDGTAHFVLAGFALNGYFGDPRLVWSGFYDTTDGAGQSSGGLFLYPWNLSPRTFTIRIWADGYYQLQPLRVTIAPPQNVSVVAYMDRASRIFGNVTGPDYFNIARHLSWATITLQPNNDTLTTIIDIEPEYYTTSSLDGSFQVWVPQGTYGMGVSLEGYATYSAQVVVPAGSDINMQIWLDNYQPSGQLGSTATLIAANSALNIRPYLQPVP
jgi:hypothetical protein